MSVINLVPEGLLSLFSSKTNGKNPNDLSSQVRGVIDLTAFYAATRAWQKDSVAGNLQNQGDTISIEVPGTEAWLLYAVNASWALGAGIDQAALSIRVDGLFQTAAAGAVIVATSQYEAPVLVGDQLRANFSPNQYLILRGGQGLTVVLDAVNYTAGGAAGAASVNTMMLRLDV